MPAMKILIYACSQGPVVALPQAPSHPAPTGSHSQVEGHGICCPVVVGVYLGLYRSLSQRLAVVTSVCTPDVTA